RLRPVGLTLAIDAPWPTPAALDAAFLPLADPPDFDARRSAGFVHAGHAEHLLRLHAPSALIAWHLNQAERFAPGDPWLAEIRAALR
ncbi:MAG: hypothetical protein KC620_04895, partial [Myxococcales bacterium]|nr:hypothetical protein [Myxococcales bacterium]